MRQRSSSDGPSGDSEQRVRIFAEVIDQHDEMQLVMAVLERNGWRARSSRRHTAMVDGMRTTGLLIDIWLNGSRRFAVEEAIRKLEDLAERAKLGLWVRDAALVEYPEITRKRYAVHKSRQRSGHRRYLGISQAWPAGRGPHRLIQVPEGTPESTLRTELARHELGQPFDHAEHSVRAIHNIVSPSLSSERLLIGLAGLLATGLCGYTFAWLNGYWRLLPLLGAIAAIALCVLALRPTGTAGRLAYIILGISLGIAGVMAEEQFTNPFKFLGALCLVSFGLFVARGAAFAVRGSWFAKNAIWTVPLTITLLAPTVPWLGGVILAQYLGQFGIPDSAVAIPTIWKVMAAGAPILVSVAVVFAIFGIVGWIRYFHLVDQYNRMLLTLMSTLIVLIYLLGSLQLGIGRAQNAARQAMIAAEAGHNPASYYGLQGVLVCLQPIHTPLSVLFGPLPVGRPVLLFEPTGNSLWAWYPGSAAKNRGAHAIRVQLPDVTVVETVGQPAACASNHH